MAEGQEEDQSRDQIGSQESDGSEDEQPPVKKRKTEDTLRGNHSLRHNYSRRNANSRFKPVKGKEKAMEDHGHERDKDEQEEDEQEEDGQEGQSREMTLACKPVHDSLSSLDLNAACRLVWRAAAAADVTERLGLATPLRMLLSQVLVTLKVDVSTLARVQQSLQLDGAYETRSWPENIPLLQLGKSWYGKDEPKLLKHDAESFEDGCPVSLTALETGSELICREVVSEGCSRIAIAHDLLYTSLVREPNVSSRYEDAIPELSTLDILFLPINERQSVPLQPSYTSLSNLLVVHAAIGISQ